MSLINCTPIKITYTRTRCCAVKGKEGEEGWQEVRGGGSRRAWHSLLPESGQCVGRTYHNFMWATGRQTVAKEARCSSSTRKEAGPRGAKGRGWLVLLFKQACANLFKNYKSARTRAKREHTHRHTHTRALYIHVCVCIYILVQAECKCAWRINLTWIKHLSRLMVCGRTNAPWTFHPLTCHSATPTAPRSGCHCSSRISTSRANFSLFFFTCRFKPLRSAAAAAAGAASVCCLLTCCNMQQQQRCNLLLRVWLRLNAARVQQGPT